MSSHSTIALSRRSSIHGTILACLLPRQRATFGDVLVSATQRAARPDNLAADANPAGESMQFSERY